MSEEINTILFLDQAVQIVRKYRARRLTLSMAHDRPIRVTSNLTTTQDQIEKFLTLNFKWIQKNLIKFKEFNQKFKVPQFAEGELFPFLGELRYLCFSESNKSQLSVAIEDGFLICYLPKNKAQIDIDTKLFEKALQRFYKSMAVKYLNNRIELWISKTGMVPAKVKFGRGRTRWGSCNSKNHIILNWKLICHAPGLIDYVILHELCHLKHLNHSDPFWNLVSSFMPEYLIYEKTLSQEVNLSRFLNFSGSVSNRE